MSRIGKTWLVWIVGIGLVACTDPPQPATAPTQPATAVQLAFAVQPSNATAGVLINPVIALAIQDVSGNLVTNATNVVTLTIGSAASGVSLAGTVSVAAVNGVATFSNVRIVTAGTGYTLKAASTGLAAATSTEFAIAAGALTSIASSPFKIAKPPVTLHVSTRTTGVSLDPDGYDLCVDPVSDDCTLSKAIGVNGDVTMPVASGAHTVELEDAAVNCTVGEATTLEAGDTIHVSFV